MKKYLILIGLVSTIEAQELSPYPNKDLTPGAINPLVTQENIQSTICTHGFNSSQRPSSSFIYKVKLKQMKEYQYSDTSLRSYIEDHLISISLGGDPKSSENLWPQPKSIFWNDKKKDKLEIKLWNKVCKNQISLKDAQEIVKTDWVSGYLKFINN